MRRQTELRGVTPRKGSESTASSGTVETRSGTMLERNLLSTLHDMERMFDEAIHRPFFGFNMTPLRHVFKELGSYGEFTPTCDIYEEGNEVIVKSDLPGLKREDVTVSLAGNELIISGERRSEEKLERKDYMVLERSHGSFSRTIGLPEGIDSENIKATFKDGVLEVRMLKLEGKNSIRKITLE